MKKVLSITVAALLACFAILCVVSVGKGLFDSAASSVSKTVKVNSEFDDSAPTHDESTSVCFTNMTEYIAYMTEQANSSGTVSGQRMATSNGNNVIQYYSPDNLPSDYEISSIIVDDTGVTFRFSKVGGVTITGNDKATLSMYNSTFSRAYKDLDFITDAPTYAMELASAIGAQHTGGSLPPSALATYSGNVTAYMPDIDPVNATVVGIQNVWIGDDGCVHYNYTPTYTQLSSSDARHYFDLVLHTISNSIAE